MINDNDFKEAFPLDSQEGGEGAGGNGGIDACGAEGALSPNSFVMGRVINLYRLSLGPLVIENSSISYTLFKYRATWFPS